MFVRSFVGGRERVTCNRSVGNARKALPAFDEFKSRKERAEGLGQRMVGRGEVVEDAPYVPMAVQAPRLALDPSRIGNYAVSLSDKAQVD